MRTAAIGLAAALVATAWQPFSHAAEGGAIRVLIVGGEKAHDFARWYGEVDRKTLEEGGLATVTYTEETGDIGKYLPDIDVLYLANNKPVESMAVRQAILDFVDSGKGLVMGHAATWYNWADWPEYNLRLAGGGADNHGPNYTFRVNVLDPSHPVIGGIGSFDVSDERYYYRAAVRGPGISVLANAGDARIQELYPSVFVVSHPKARIVGITLGHDGGSHDLPQYRQILRQAIRWVSNRAN